MTKRLAVLGLMLLVAAVAVAQSQSAGKPSNFTVTLRIDQGVTQRHSHPPAGDPGDTFSVDLTLFTIKDEFNMNPNTRVGNMNFAYALHGTCSATGSGCKGTVDIQTLTKLPGGTITATAKGVPIRTPFVVKVTKGTGRYAGATGKIVVAPGGAARNVFNLTLK